MNEMKKAVESVSCKANQMKKKKKWLGGQEFRNNTKEKTEQRL